MRILAAQPTAMAGGMNVCSTLGPMGGWGDGSSFLAIFSLILIISAYSKRVGYSEYCQGGHEIDISFKISKFSCVRGL